MVPLEESVSSMAVASAVARHGGYDELAISGPFRWTKFLIPHAKRFVGVDLSAECVEGCRASFIEAKHATFLQNDGVSLKIIPNNLDFVFSFDSLVHVEIDILATFGKF